MCLLTMYPFTNVSFQPYFAGKECSRAEATKELRTLSDLFNLGILLHCTHSRLSSGSSNLLLRPFLQVFVLVSTTRYSERALELVFG